MPDPNVREVGAVHDMDGSRIPVGVDYDTVVILGYRLTQEQAEEFGHLFISACWQAARQVPGDEEARCTGRPDCGCGHGYHQGADSPRKDGRL